MNVFVIGGTGFLGYHAVHELLRRGHRATVLALPPAPPQGTFLPEVQVTLADLNKLVDEEVLALLAGQEAVVYAAGADDRVVPKAPAYDFFYNANVKPTARLFALARRAGVKRGVLLSSYFAHFDRIWPELRLADHHPYVCTRQEQECQALEAAGQTLDLVILELPYIFGAAPGRVPLWAPIIAYLRSPLPVVFYPRGGTNMIAVRHVAEAIAGALERGEGGERYVIGEANLTWAEWLTRLSQLLGRPKRVITLPDWVATAGLWGVHVLHRLQGREGGLDPVQFARLQTRNTFFDPKPARRALGFGQGGLDEALAETVKACLAGR
jgi:dihydroflavonol-4-reductase